MPDLTPTAVGTWSGGRFMRFGVPLDDDRFAALVRPGDGIGTVLTADAVALLEAVERDARVPQLLRGRDAGGAGADHTCRRERHASSLTANMTGVSTLGGKRGP